jgi:ABC-type uncharacterized transport system substrate-binding protein
MKATALKERIGFLYSGSESSLRAQLVAFHRGLKEAKYVDGQNIKIEYLSADHDYDRRLPELAAKLVGHPVEVIVAAGGQVSAVAAKKANDDAKRAIPIVFTTVANPVALGLVASLHRPGGNLTGTAGLTSELDPARLELLHQVMRSQNGKSKQEGTFGAIRNPKRPRVGEQSVELQAAADAIRRELVFLDAGLEHPLEEAVTKFVKTKLKGEGGALVVTADPFFNGKRDELVAIAAKLKIPAIYQWREFVTAGGLMSYGPSIADAYYQAGIYVGRILDGERPGDLPVLRPAKFELVLNLRTAATLGLKFPPDIIGRPDAEVIE